MPTSHPRAGAQPSPGPGPRDIALMEQLNRNLREKTKWPTTIGGWAFLVLQMWVLLYVPFAAAEGTSAFLSSGETPDWGWIEIIVLGASFWTIIYLLMMTDRAREKGIGLREQQWQKPQ